jgi:hypothetical protein
MSPVSEDDDLEWNEIIPYEPTDLVIQDLESHVAGDDDHTNVQIL